MGESFFRGKEMKLFNIRSLIDYFMQYYIVYCNWLILKILIQFMYVYVYCMILVYISEKVEMFIKIRIYRVEIIYGVIFGKWLDMFYCNILFFYFYFDFFSMK